VVPCSSMVSKSRLPTLCFFLSMILKLRRWGDQKRGPVGRNLNRNDVAALPAPSF
jgi:hypothetical protein